MVVLDGNLAVDLEWITPKCICFSDARTNRCYSERGSRTNYVRSSIPHCTVNLCGRGLGSCIVLFAVLMSGAYRVPHAPSQTLACVILIWISDLVPLFRSARYVGFGLTAKVRQTFICQLLVASAALCRFRDLLFLFFFFWGGGGSNLTL